MSQCSMHKLITKRKREGTKQFSDCAASSCRKFEHLHNKPDLKRSRQGWGRKSVRLRKQFLRRRPSQQKNVPLHRNQPKKKRTSLSQAKTPEERTAIINARMGKTPEATKKQRKPASSRKKKERAVSKKAASKKKKPSRAKVYQNPEDSEEDNERVENSLYDSKEEGKGHRHHNSDIDGSDVEEEIVERTTTKITTTIRKKKGSMSSTRRTTSDSTKRTVDGRGSFLVTANLFLIAAVVACAFYLCMPIFEQFTMRRLTISGARTNELRLITIQYLLCKLTASVRKLFIPILERATTMNSCV